MLYPDDRTYQGKELRLKQQHFFVSATIQARPALVPRCAFRACLLALAPLKQQTHMTGAPCAPKRVHCSIFKAQGPQGCSVTAMPGDLILSCCCGSLVLALLGHGTHNNFGNTCYVSSEGVLCFCWKAAVMRTRRKRTNRGCDPRA